MQTIVTGEWKPLASAQTSPWYLRLLPSLTDFTFILPLFLLFGMLSGATQLLSDGDTGWHIRTGDWILQHGQVPTTDPFSFTMPGRTWFAWEWAWDAAFAAIHNTAGLAGVAFVNVLLICVSSVLVFRLIRRYTNNDLLSFAFTMLAVCGSMIHWLARPHLISWVFALIFAHLILSAEEGKLRRLVVAPALMIAWTNLHGGFFLGILLLLAWAVGDALQVTFSSDRLSFGAYRKSAAYLACAAACAIATLLNPYGWHLHQHVIGYLRDSTLLDNISEFQTISFHNPGSIFFECMLVIGTAAAFWCFNNRLTGLGLTVLIWAHAALFSGRNIPIFMLLSAPAAALMTQHLLGRLAHVRFLEGVAADIRDLVSDLRGMERVNRAYVASGLAVLLLALGMARGKGVFRAEFNPKNFPIPAISTLRSAGVDHLFTTDQWADYLLYRYYPEQKVFFDGRSDFYGGTVVKQYQHMMSAQYDCEDLLKKFSIDAVMVKTDAPLATLLKRVPDWKLRYDDGTTIIFRLRRAEPR
jgi:hypothetical protein